MHRTAHSPRSMARAGVGDWSQAFLRPALRPCSRGVWPRRQALQLHTTRGSPVVASYTTAPVTSLTPLRHTGEHTFNLAEYMVVLDKPIGLTLAPDPATGQIVVQSIKEGSPAAECGMIQVGDVVTMCSAVLGEDMWQAVDIRRIRWAINNRTSKIKLVLQRTSRDVAAPSWYCRGQVGHVSQERDLLQLPVSFTTPSLDDWPQDMPAPGRPLTVSFHSCPTPGTNQQQAPPRTSAAEAARVARLQALRNALAEARREPQLELGSPPKAGGMAGAGAGANTPGPTAGGSPGGAGSPTGGATRSNSSNGVGPFGRLMESLTGGMVAGTSAASNNGSSMSSNDGVPSGQGTSAQNPSSASQQGSRTGMQVGASGKDRKAAVPVLPWLLVSTCRLDTRDLTQIASHRGLSAMLELGLCRVGGSVAVRGATMVEAAHPPPIADVSVSNFLPPSPGGAGAGGAAGAAAAAGILTHGRAGSDGYDANTQGGSGAAPNPASEQRYRQLIHAAAALQRLAIRRLHGSVHHSPPEACTVLLHCFELGMEPDVACLLAAWLHWYGRMPLQEALLSAEIALGCAVEQGVVEAATQALVAAAEERCNRVVLTWRYGGLSASVAGDVVGSWSTRMPLLRCKNPMGCKGSVARGNFYLELAGLRPGVYYYKYIVDGTWAVDPASPKVLDASGNWNNVLEVQHRQPLNSSREQLAAARWHAARLSWETKMGLRLGH